MELGLLDRADTAIGCEYGIARLPLSGLSSVFKCDGEKAPASSITECWVLQQVTRICSRGFHWSHHLSLFVMIPDTPQDPSASCIRVAEKVYGDVGGVSQI